MKNFFFLLFFSLTDIITTLIVLGSGGKELNPLAREAMNFFGLTEGMIIMKTFVILVVFIQPDEDLRSKTALSIAVLYGVVSVWNLFVWV